MNNNTEIDIEIQLSILNVWADRALFYLAKIYTDQIMPRHEQMFECAHEMGHMFLHKKANAIFMDTRTGFNTS